MLLTWLDEDDNHVSVSCIYSCVCFDLLYSYFLNYHRRQPSSFFSHTERVELPQTLHSSMKQNDILIETFKYLALFIAINFGEGITRCGRNQMLTKNGGMGPNHHKLHSSTHHLTYQKNVQKITSQNSKKMLSRGIKAISSNEFKSSSRSNAKVVALYEDPQLDILLLVLTISLRSKNIRTVRLYLQRLWIFNLESSWKCIWRAWTS